MSSSPFTNAIAQGLTSRRTLAGLAVTYSDGTESGSVTAVKGSPNVKTADALAVNMTERYVDWMIAAADLAALDPAVATPPARGHTITIDGDTYKVVPFERGPAWEYVDAGETEYRIHTIKTGGTL